MRNASPPAFILSVLLGVTLIAFFTAAWVTRPSPADIAACVAATSYDAARCHFELTR